MGYLWIDTETGGLDPVKDAVVQLAAVVTDDDLRIRAYFMSYIKPPDYLNLGEVAVNIHGISRDAVKDAPAEGTVMRSLEKLVHGFKDTLTFAGFSCKFDMDFVSQMEIRSNIKVGYQIPAYDVLEIARTKLHLPSYKLVHVREHYKMATAGAHDAGRDISDTIRIARKLREEVAA